MRGATTFFAIKFIIAKISTHTPLAGCNQITQDVLDLALHFYSHTPCGVQHISNPNFTRIKKFLLTHPLRGATPMFGYISTFCPFLLTHPLRGATKSTGGTGIIRKFLLTHPLRGATCWIWHIGIICPFLLTHPLRGATCWYLCLMVHLKISTHTPLAGCNKSQTNQH